MGNIPVSEASHVQVAAVRKAWVEAVVKEDVSRLMTLTTDDVVVVRGNGQSLRGKNELKTAFLQAFERFDVERTELTSEITFQHDWAIEIDEVKSTRAPLESVEAPIYSQFGAVFIFRRQLDDSWKIARIVELST